MLLGRQNPRGGPRLKEGSFPLREDPRTKEFGLLIGYMEDGEYVLVPLSLANDVANRFGDNLKGYRKMVGRRARRPFKEWLFTLMFSQKDYVQLKDRMEATDDMD